MKPSINNLSVAKTTKSFRIVKRLGFKELIRTAAVKYAFSKFMLFHIELYW